jgi:hypothetical protein
MTMRDLVRTTAAMAVIGGCTPDGSASRCLSRSVVRNIEYRTEHVGEQRVKLVDGRYDNYDLRLNVMLMDTVAYGDLDGDDMDEAVVVLVTNTGGSGVFHYLAAIGCRNGSATHIASAFMGDRVKIRRLSVGLEMVVVDMIAHGESEALCCPTERISRKYRLDGDRLVEIETH